MTKSTSRTLRSKPLRNALFIAAGGRCSICSEPLGDVFHADHIEPWRLTKTTNLHQMQATCPACNLKKGANHETA